MELDKTKADRALVARGARWRMCAWKSQKRERERELISQSTCFDQRDIVKIECLSGTMATAETFKWIICPPFLYSIPFPLLSYSSSISSVNLRVCLCVCLCARVSICLVSVRACVQRICCRHRARRTRRAATVY